MNTPTPSADTLPPGDNNPFALLDQLLAQGVISTSEHTEQCRRVARDLVLQRQTQQNRQTFVACFPVQPFDIPTPETTMNTQDLLNTMQLNSRIMTEQFKALNALSHPPTQHAVRQGDAAENAAELLNHLSNAHLGNAAISLQTLAGAAAKARSEWAQENLPPPVAPNAESARNNTVIDVEAVEVAEVKQRTNQG